MSDERKSNTERERRPSPHPQQPILVRRSPQLTSSNVTATSSTITTGILRLNKPRRSSGSSVEFRDLKEGYMQVEPTSPQPSVDRLSVTFAKDEPSVCSDSSTRVNVMPAAGSYRPPPLNVNGTDLTVDKVRFLGGMDGDGEDDEDYSVSVSAIIQRNASFRRSRGRSLKKRRPSSPFTPEADSAVNRRRSSVFTTSSADDTAISMEGSGGGSVTRTGVTQEQIMENLRVHKEVVSSVKLQPWDMRRKIRLVRQAKTYVKKHEGQLQERLAHSRTTRDMLARFNLWLLKKWQRLRREVANLLNIMIPWELRIKEIQSHFGSVVASYFTFLRWLCWVNLVITVVIVAFVVVPEILTADPKSAGERKEMLPEERKTSTNIATLWDFEGILKYSPLFYGYYSDREGKRKGFRVPFAYFLTGLAVYVYSFVAILRKMAANSRMSKLSEKDDECIFTWKMFAGWDYMIGNSETAHNRVASTVLGFKEALLEEAEKQREERNWKIMSVRFAVNLTVLGLLGSSAYVVVLVVQRSTEPDAESTLWRRNETTVVINFVNFVFPILFEVLGMLERYHPRKTLRFQLARIMALNLLNLYTLIFSMFQKISDMSVELEKVKSDMEGSRAPTVTATSVTLTMMPSTIGPGCVQTAVRCGTRAATFVLVSMATTPGLSPSLTSLSATSTSLGKLLTTPMVGPTYTTSPPPLDSTTPLVLNTTDIFFNHSYYENITEMFNTLNYTRLPGNETIEVDNEVYYEYPEVETEQESLSQFLEAKYSNDQSTVNENTTTYTTWNDLDSTVMDNTTTWSVSTEESTSITPSELISSTDLPSTVADISRQETTLQDILRTFSDVESQSPSDTTCYVTRCSDASSTTPVMSSSPMHGRNASKRVSKYDLETRRKLRRLCWETMFGQELVKMTVMDLVMTIASTLLIDFFRAVFVRVMNRCWCWDLEKKFPQYGDFKIAENILHLVNNQGMVWMGMFFSPGLPLINLVKLAIMMYLRSWAVLTCNVPHEVVFRASRSNNFYFALLLTMLFLCVLPVGYAIMQLAPSWHCGPFSTYPYVYKILTGYVHDAVPKSLHPTLSYATSAGIVIPLLLLLSLVIYYLVSLTNSLREANNDLKIQLRRERTEERRKMFQLVDKRGGGDLSEKWRKLIPALPSLTNSAATDGEPVKAAGATADAPNAGEVKTSASRRNELISRLLKHATRKSSATSEEDSAARGIPPDGDATDEEQPDCLPDDRVKQSIKKPIRSAKVRTQDVEKKREVPRVATASSKSKPRPRPQSPSVSSANHEREDSVASAWSDNIPEIRISKTESSECVLEHHQTAEPQRPSRTGSSDTIVAVDDLPPKTTETEVETDKQKSTAEKHRRNRSLARALVLEAKKRREAGDKPNVEDKSDKSGAA